MFSRFHAFVMKRFGAQARQWQIGYFDWGRKKAGTKKTGLPNEYGF